MLKVRKSGNIDKGEIFFSYEGENICYSAWVKLKFGFVTKRFDTHGKYAIEKEKLLSKNLKQGASFKIDGVNIDIDSVANGVGYASITSPEYSGTIQLDLSKELIDIIAANINVRYSGLSFKICAERV